MKKKKKNHLAQTRRIHIHIVETFCSRELAFFDAKCNRKRSNYFCSFVRKADAKWCARENIQTSLLASIEVAAWNSILPSRSKRRLLVRVHISRIKSLRVKDQHLHDKYERANGILFFFFIFFFMSLDFYRIRTSILRMFILATSNIFCGYMRVCVYKVSFNPLILRRSPLLLENKKIIKK